MNFRNFALNFFGVVDQRIVTGVTVSALRPTDQANAKARQLILDRVEQTSINGLLGARMAGRSIFAVPLAVKTPATPSAGGDIYDTVAPPANRLHQHVLILGEPGAGKTIFLLGAHPEETRRRARERGATDTDHDKRLCLAGR